MSFISSPTASVRCGLNVLHQTARRHDLLDFDGAVGLLTNHTGFTREGVSAFDVLQHFGLNVRALFSPEHGPTGTREGNIESTQTPNGLPVHSLYGKTRRATVEMLEGLQAVVCDLQDAGARFYTYSTTVAYLLEECAARGIAGVILDRPNPIGGQNLSGPLLESAHRSFVGYLPVPVTHGLTLGEAALLHRTTAQRDLEGNARDLSNLDLRVVPVENWNRAMSWPDTGLPWRAPSPNLPDFQAATWYAGLCLLEFSGVAVGRGTHAPFQIVGAPWLEPQRVLDDIENWPSAVRDCLRAEIIEFTPTRAIYENQSCHGLYFQNSGGDADAAPHDIAALGMAIQSTLYRTHREHFGDAEMDKSLILLGSSRASIVARRRHCRRAAIGAS